MELPFDYSRVEAQKNMAALQRTQAKEACSFTFLKSWKRNSVEDRASLYERLRIKYDERYSKGGLV